MAEEFQNAQSLEEICKIADEDIRSLDRDGLLQAALTKAKPYADRQSSLYAQELEEKRLYSNSRYLDNVYHG